MHILSRLLRALAYFAATAVIVLALVVGVLRLLLPLVPEYQQDIRRIAAATIGLDVDFERISASWPLRGPQLKLYEVRLSDPANGETVLEADAVSLGLSLYRFLTEQRIRVNYVGVTGSALSVERDADGGWRAQGRRLETLLPAQPDAGDAEMPRLDLAFEDLGFDFVDRAGDEAELSGNFRRLRLSLEPDAVMGEALAELGGARGQLELTVDLSGRLLGRRAAPDTVEWDFTLAATGAELPPLLRLVTPTPLPLLGGRGDLLLAGRFVGSRPESVLAELDLSGVEFGAGADSSGRFERVAGNFEWEARSAGWLLAATELRLTRGQRQWPRSEFTLTYDEDAGTGLRRVAANASFLRLEDLYAGLQGIATPRARAELLPEALGGDLQALRIAAELQQGQPPRYSVEAGFDNLMLRNYAGGRTVTGLSGVVAADHDGGRLELDASDVEVALPTVFSEPVTADSLAGLLVWRNTPDGLRVLSDSVQLRSAAGEARTRFELSLPENGDGLRMDLDASVRSDDARQVLGYLPLERFPPDVSRWLQDAIRAGRVPEARIRFRGALREFPYDHGEGLFRVDLQVAEGRLEFAKGWPPVEQLSGELVFDGVRLFSRNNSAVFAGLPVSDVDVRFDDLRRGELSIAAEENLPLDGLLGFLRLSPMAQQLGPALSRVRGAGPVASSMELMLPMLRLQDYSLRAVFDAQSARLGIQGLDFGFTDITGRLLLDRTRLSAESLEAKLLGHPVRASLRPVEAEGSSFSHYALITGRTPVGDWTQAFGFEAGDRIGGAAPWRALAMVPRAGRAKPTGFELWIHSDLDGVRSGLPAPFAKAADETARLELHLGFGEPGAIDVDGGLRDDLRWRMRLAAATEGWRLERGEFRFGGEEAVLPAEPGLFVSGRLRRFELADWLAVAGQGESGWPAVDPGALGYLAWRVDELVLFGQVFRDMDLEMRPEEAHWLVESEGPNLAGRLRMPRAGDGTWSLALDRLHLRADDSGGAGGSPLVDPRLLPAMRISIQDFRMADMAFDQLYTELRPGPDGLTVSPLRMSGESFEITGDGAWLVVGEDPARQRSRLRARLVSEDVETSLLQLGYTPVIDSDRAEVTADLSWPGGPDGNFLRRASGELNIEFGPGSLLELDAGGGRLLGILSVASLPRRLSLDFRDVFDEGLGFDSLRGDFSLDEGDAFTCNLGLEGSVADMGIVGRTGLRDRDYEQLAVVRPHVSNVLALGGVAVGGPAVGAAALLISQIFRKPLSQLGESYYEIEGPWEDARVERVVRAEVDTARFSDCEEYLQRVLPEDAFDTIVPRADAESSPTASGAPDPVPEAAGP